MSQAAQKPPREKDPRKEELDELRGDIRAMRALLKDLSDHSPAKLARVKKLVASVPEGAELLKLASQTKTRIGFGKKMDARLAGLTETLGDKFNYAAGKGVSMRGKQRYRVTLDPQMTTHETALTLAHELRHVWQNVQLDKGRSVTLTPALMVTMSRLQEGDARAFEEYFKQRLSEQKNGLPAAPFSAAAWKRAFLAYQKNTSLSGGYDKGPVEVFGQLLKTLAKEIPEEGKRKKVLSKLFNSSAASGLKGADKILRAGLSKNAKPYMTFSSPEQMAKKITGYAKPSTRKKLRKLEHGIATGKT